MRTLLMGLVVVGAVLPRLAHAQEPPPAPPSAAPPAATEATAEPPPDAIALEARAHHRRGLELYDEGEFRLALVELERAYAVGKSYKVLFNIGQVHFQLKSYSRARLALEQYLSLGGDQINAKRRTDVEADLVTLRGRTASLTVRVNVEGAEVVVNDTFLGTSPLEGKVVDAGTIRVHVAHKGYGSQSREIALAGGDMQTMTIDLAEERPSVIVAPPSNGLPAIAIAGWVVAGALAASAVGTGIAANAASSSYDAQRSAPITGSPESARADLERRRDRVSALALATDVLAVTALVAGGISLYLTLRDRPKPDAPRQGPSARSAGGGTVVIFGF